MCCCLLIAVLLLLAILVILDSSGRCERGVGLTAKHAPSAVLLLLLLLLMLPTAFLMQAQLV